jgi:hypothetical protein
MAARCAIVFVAVLIPGVCRGQNAPESLLSAQTQLYFRWDGVTPHRSAYARSAAGQALAGDLGAFLQETFFRFHDLLRTSVASDKLLSGTTPEAIELLQTRVADLPKLLTLLADKGFVLAGELRSIEPFSGQLLFIVPNAGKDAAYLSSAVHLFAALRKVPVEEKVASGRKFLHFPVGSGHLVVWENGDHALLALSTEPPDRVLANVPGTGPRLADKPVLKQVNGFTQFETVIRAFVDLEPGLRLARSFSKEAAKLLDGLGLDNARSLTFLAGFEGAVEHRITELRLDGPRHGLFGLISRRSFTAKDIPALSPDTDSWLAANLDLSATLTLGVQALAAFTAIISPDQTNFAKDALADLEKVLGINLRGDLLNTLGDRIVFHTCPYDGLSFFGATLFIKVNDAQKLQATLDRMDRTLNKGGLGRMKRRTYNGVVLREFQPRQPVFVLPTFAIHDGWLIVGLFPQPVRAYVLRATGVMPAWQPDDHVRSALTRLPRQFVGVSFSDPRSFYRQFAPLGPLFAAATSSFQKDSPFTPSAFPSVPEVNRHLFPNVSVLTDDGKTLRLETHASLAFPFDINGLTLFAFFSSAGLL